jgi:HK97 family phage major capsid protein
VTTPFLIGGTEQMSLLDEARALRDAAHNERGHLLDTAASEKRAFSDEEEAKYQAAGTRHAALTERVAQLEREARQEASAAGVRKLVGGYTNDGLRGGTYHPQGEHSFFGDLINARSGDYEAIQRLHTNNAEQRTNAGLGSYTSSHGADFSPPGYLNVVEQARAGAVFANLVHQEQLPPGVSSANLPRILSTGGTTTAVQATQNSGVSNVDAATDLLTASVTTIAGAQIVSQQLLDQTPSYGGSTIDEILMRDLAADYARTLDTQALYGSGGSGQLQGYMTKVIADAVMNQTWTITTATAPKFFAKIGELVSLISTSRLKAPDAIVCHPRRFSWLASCVDSAGRPYVNAEGSAGSGQFANLGVQSAVAAEGPVGSIQGIPVYSDANITTVFGTSTNQDQVLVFCKDDPWLWTSPIVAEVLPTPYATTLGVYLRLYSYSAFIPNRYPLGNGAIAGAIGTGSTGLITPSFSTT